jgi:DNA primase
VLRDGREARFLFLPEGEDPDTLIRKTGREAFEERIAQATHLSDFLLDHLSQPLDLDSIDGRARLVDLARPLLAKLPDGIFHQLLLERLADIAGTDPARLSSRMDRRAETATPPEGRRPAPQGGAESPVRGAIAMLLHQPALAREVKGIAFMEPAALPGVTLLQELLELLWRRPDLNTGALLEHWRDREEGRHLEKLAQWRPLVEELDLAAEFHGHIDRIQQLLAEGRISILLGIERKRTLNSHEKQELKELLQARQAGGT